MPGAARPAWYLRGWLLYGGVALLFGGYLGLNALIDQLGHPRVGAWEPMVWEMSSALTVFALVPGIALLERRVPVDSRPRGRVVAVHLAGVVLFSTLHVAGMVGLRKLAYVLMDSRYDFGSLALRGFYELQKDVISYAVVLTVLFAYRQFKVRREGELRAAHLATELAESRLRHLTAQIEPHFLFNTLNAISNRMHEDVDAADRMISQLGSLLRTAYDSDGELKVPMATELAWLEGYAAMMTERFRGKLEVDLQVEPGLDAVPVPRLLLQPLLENALRHGLPDGRGRVVITVRREGGRLHYGISDDGVGLKDPPRAGTGLANIEHRVQLLYPGEGRFEIGPQAPRGTRVRVSFPA